MTAKEKAQELVGKLTLSSNAQDGSWMCEDLAKQCALIAVDEIIESRKEDRAFDDREWEKSSDYFTPHPMGLTYWEQVKHELNKSE